MNFFKTSDYWSTTGEIYSCFGIEHIISITAMILIIITLFIFGKKISHRHVKIFLFISMILWWMLEIVKISIFFSNAKSEAQLIRCFRDFLPIYLCSLFLYALPLALFGKGALRDAGEGFLITLALPAGILSATIPAELSYYPFFSFMGLHTILYHAAMAIVAAIVIATGYVKPKWQHILWAGIFVYAFAIPAIVANFIIPGNADYMLLFGGWDTPLEAVAKILPQPVYMIFILILYLASIFAITYINIGVRKLAYRRKLQKTLKRL